MIGRLTGKVVECAPGRVLLDVGGVGYTLQIPLSTYYVLSSGPGSTRSLHVHTRVREDAFQLYGFAAPEERAAFEQLIGISGVGPRIALAMLSGIGVEELQQTVNSQDCARLEKIPGVGKKTAARVLLELRGKPTPLGGDAAAPPSSRRPAPQGMHGDAVSALVNLGYTRETAERAVARGTESIEGQATLEEILKATLRSLVR